jgi:hypothetical protein
MIGTALKGRDDGAAPHADYSDYRMLSSGSMDGGLRLGVVAGIVAAGLSGACREAPAPAVDKSAASSTVAPRSLSVGDPAPEFSLPGSDGKQYSLAAYRGRQAVVLAWFSKAFTEG